MMNGLQGRVRAPARNEALWLVRPPVSRVMVAGVARAVLVALVGVLAAGSLGCFGTANLVPKQANLSPDAIVHVAAGRGVRFVSFDGARVRAHKILAAPGSHSVRLAVRRNLKGLDEETLEGIYQIGECRIELDARAGGNYEVTTRVFAEERYLVIDQKERKDGAEQVVGLTLHVLDLDRGKEFRAPPDACKLKIDCRRIDRSKAKAGSECTFDG